MDGLQRFEALSKKVNKEEKLSLLEGKGQLDNRLIAVAKHPQGKKEDSCTVPWPKIHH
jgi:hypothetical protein